MAKPITLDNVRFSFLNVFQAKPPYSDPAGKPKFSATILVPKTNVRAKQMIDAAIQEAINEGVASKWNGVRPPQPPTPVHDGDGTRPSDGAEYGPECKGHWVFTASATVDYPPTVVGLDRQSVINQAEIYSGMYGAVNVTFFAYNAPGKKGIGCGLNGLMKTHDGEPLAAQRQTVDEMFGGPPQQPVQPQYQPQPQGGYLQPQGGYLPMDDNFAQPAQEYQQPTQQPQQPQQQRINPFTGLPVDGGVMGL